MSPGEFRWPMVSRIGLKEFDEGFAILRQVDSSKVSCPDFFGLFGMLTRRIPGQEATAEAAYLRSLEFDPNRPDIL